MATFSYTAYDNAGKQIKGNLEAANVEQATALLKAEGKLPISVNSASALNKDVSISFLDSKPKVRDLAVFCRQFVSITSAGVPVTSALEMLAEQTENKMLKNALSECLTSIQSGSSLSEAMALFPKVFPSLLITMVAAGEASGSLEISFSRMADQFEKDSKLQAMIKKASVYPTVVVIVAFAVVTLMLLFVVPQFEAMLTDLGSELPTLTKIVVGASDFMAAYWYIVVGVIVGIVFAIRAIAKTDGGKLFFGSIQLKAPLFGNLTVKSASARMCRTLSTLIAAGIPLIDAIEIVAKTMSNFQFRNALMDARDDVSMGTALSEPLMRGDLFPPLVCHMTKIGEETGDIEGMMNKVADYYDEEVETAVAAVVAAIEPALIIILAVIIGAIVGAVMMPMVEMYNALGNL